MEKKKDNSITFIKTPNNVVMTRGKLNIYEHRVLTRVMQALQVDMNSYYNSASPFQLSLFNPTSNNIPLKIPYKSLMDSPNNYHKIDEAIKTLMERTVRAPMRNEKKEEVIVMVNLFKKAIIPTDSNKRRDYVTIIIDQEMIDFYMNLKLGYTKNNPELPFSTSSTQTIILYQLLSRWKDKKFFKISVDDLKEELEIEKDSYKEFKIFKRDVLVAIQKELISMDESHLFFDMTFIKEARKVTQILFNIKDKKILNLQDEANLTQKTNIINLLKTYHKFEDKNFKKIEAYLQDSSKYDIMLTKIVELKDLYDDDQKQFLSGDKPKLAIQNIASYTQASLIKLFDDLEKVKSKNEEE